MNFSQHCAIMVQNNLVELVAQLLKAIERVGDLATLDRT